MRESYVRLVFSNSMLLETLIAFSKMSLRYYVSPEQRMTADIWSHISRVLRQLQQLLASQISQQRESVILCAYYLAVLCQASGDLESFRVHHMGLKHLVSLGLPSELSTNTGFLLVRLGSAEMYTRYLAEVQNNYPHPHVNQSYALSQSTQAPSCLYNDFQDLIETGGLTIKGLNFLRDAEIFLGRPYTASLADKMTTLLTLRMVEASHATSFPAHGLFTQQAPTGS